MIWAVLAVLAAYGIVAGVILAVWWTVPREEKR